MKKYFLQTKKYFDRKYKKIIRKNPKLVSKIGKTLHLLASDPFYSGLKTHKAVSVRYGENWSSRVTKDLRIIWNFNKKELNVLDILDLGGHRGKYKVYK